MATVRSPPPGSPERISGWGLHPVVNGVLDMPRSDAEIAQALREHGSVIARGNGRSYGDSSFNARGALSMLKRDRMLAFDAQEGLLTCEAGVILGDVITALLPLGWFPPVTPGSKYVTIGGMIASNVHGKNAVRDGAFGDHVAWLDLMRADGTVVRCSAQENAALFADTVGGMGLTGVILRAAFRLKRVESAWVRQDRQAHGHLDAVLAAFEASEATTYRVAWIDVLAKGASLGRSILDLGEHAKLDDVPAQHRANPFQIRIRGKKSVPFAPPFSPLNGLTVSAFNTLHYARGKASAGRSVVDWDSYFYPLDALLHWNRIYGRAGFAQYQCVLPRAEAREGLVALLEAISGAGRGSFLAVLKRIGNTCGTLSFPMDGYTLALDFPWSQPTARLLDRLDEITLRHGGRVYLTKDCRLRAPTLRAMQPVAETFRTRREADGHASRFQSLQSERLAL
jgi:FAD/FMN-containing dehydrogenase